MSKTLEKAYLLVSFEDNFNENIEQEILEIALQYDVIPYTCKEDENSLILEIPSKKVLSHFCERLISEEFPITFKEFSR